MHSIDGRAGIMPAPFTDAMSMRLRFLFLLACLWLLPAVAMAADCDIALKPSYRGFPLNPTVEKVVVSKVTPKRGGTDCAVRAGDEILQVNSQRVPGERALKVLSYWRSLKKGVPRTYRLRRNGQVLTLTI